MPFAAVMFGAETASTAGLSMVMAEVIIGRLAGCGGANANALRGLGSLSATSSARKGSTIPLKAA